MQRQVDLRKFEASLVHLASSKTARSIQKTPVWWVSTLNPVPGMACQPLLTLLLEVFQIENAIKAVETVKSN